MLSEQDIRAMVARRTRTFLPVMVGAIGAMFLYLLGVGSFREPLNALAVSRFGEAARVLTPIALILPALAIFLLPSCLAARYAGRFRTACPACHADISSRTGRVLSTLCCPACGERILEGGRPHSAAVYHRYQALRERHDLMVWFWAWTALGLLFVAWHFVDRSAFQRCPRVVWVGPLIGAATAGWAWLRTSERRYVAPLLASIGLLGLGALL